MAAELRPAAAWRAQLQARADCAPRNPRVPLTWGPHRIGSVEPWLFERTGLRDAALLRWVAQAPEAGWQLQGELSATLAQVAVGLREAGLAHTWRNEQLPVHDAAGQMLGTVERAVVRALGIATQAVHLLALDARGAHWVQQRAFDKPTDPGLWDTLVGGLVPAGETLPQALERESWEEAGLRLQQVQALRRGGRLLTRRPFREQAHGYVVEWLDWWTCVLPDGVLPQNQDGEVAGFRCMAAQEVSALLEQDGFTVDAALMLLAAYA